MESKPAVPHLAWIFSGRLDAMLDSATWLRTTQELRKLGWRVSLIAAGDRRGAKTIQGVEVFCLTNPDVYLLRQLIFHFKVWSYLFQQGDIFDLILFSQASALWLLPLKLIRFLRRQQKPLLVMDTRTVPMENLQQATLRDQLRGGFANLMNRWGNAWADGQTAISIRMAECVKIPPARLWGVWPSGVDLAQFAPAQTAHQWPTGEEPIRLAYIGVLHHERNLLTLCQAVEAAQQEKMNFTLSLTGWGTAQNELTRFASQTEGRIQVHAAIPNEQIPAVLAQVHVGVLPFPDEEKYRVCSPIKLFEYLGAGLPVLATQVVCFTDVIGEGDYVFWAANASLTGLLAALRQLWAARATLPTKSTAAAHAAQTWTWQESAHKLSDALKFGLWQKKEQSQTRFVKHPLSE